MTFPSTTRTEAPGGVAGAGASIELETRYSRRKIEDTMNKVSSAPGEDTILYLRNPYSRIPPSLLLSVCRACRVDLSYGAKELWTLDEVCRDPWFEPIRKATLDSKIRITRLPLEALICLAARLEAPISGLPSILHTRDAVLLLISRVRGRPRYKILRRISDEVLTELLIQIGYYPDRSYFAILTREEKELRFRSGTFLPYTSEHRRLASRYQEVNSHPQSSLIKRLYGTGNQYLRATPTWEEQVIRSIGERDLELCRNLQIRVPEGYTPGDWLRENILEYLSIWNRKPGEVEERRRQNLPWYSLMTDEELAQECRIYVPYSSRRELVETLTRMHRSPTFFLPHKSWPKERALNQRFETFGLGLDIRTCSELLVGFGSWEKAYLYTLEDLLDSFYFEDGFFAFRCPHAPQREIFTLRQIKDLIILLSFIAEGSEVEELLERISKGLRWQAQEGTRLESLQMAFRRMTREDQEFLRSFLHRMISVGFYARRWEGPGTPLPLREADTLKELDPDPLTLKNWTEATTALREASSVLRELVWSLRTFRYRQGELEPRKGSLRYWWKGVGRGTICIRVASAVLIGTAYTYLDLLFLEQPTDFQIQEVDLIV